MNCPDCKGTGQTTASFVDYADGSAGHNVAMKCTRCQGAGECSPETARWIVVGGWCRGKRLDPYQKLTALADVLGFGCAEISGMEHGRQDPEILATYWEEITGEDRP